MGLEGVSYKKYIVRCNCCGRYLTEEPIDFIDIGGEITLSSWFREGDICLCYECYTNTINGLWNKDNDSMTIKELIEKSRLATLSGEDKQLSDNIPLATDVNDPCLQCIHTKQSGVCFLCISKPIYEKLKKYEKGEIKNGD